MTTAWRSLALDLVLLPFTAVYELVNPKRDDVPATSVPDSNPR